MSFLYPSLVTISRPNQNAALGSQGYGGVSAADEAVIAQAVPAHIQADRQGTRPQSGLPADAAGQSIWKIIFKAAKGLVQDRDIITDDVGRRFQVVSADWGPLVTTCRSQILEV